MNKKQISLILMSLAMMLASTAVFAQTFGQGLNGSPGSTLSIQRVLGILTGLTCWLSRIALSGALIAIIIYGIIFFFAQANPTRFSEAKKAFSWGIVGVLVIFGTYSIMATVYSTVDPTSTFVKFAPLKCSAGGGLPITP